LQDYTLRFRVEGIGSIVIGEQAFNDQEVAYSKIITTDGDKISVSVQETKEFFSIHFDTSNKGPQFIMFTVNSDSFLKSIRKLRVQFHGNVLVHRMSIVCRAWKTDFCLENTGLCALKCEWEADKCVRLGNCMRAPVSACSVCKRNFMSTILNNTKGSSTEFLISSLREAAYYRESLDVLSDDVFFTAYRDVAMDWNPIMDRLQTFRKQIGAYCCEVVGCVIEGNEVILFTFKFSSRIEDPLEMKENFGSIVNFVKSITPRERSILKLYGTGYLCHLVNQRMSVRNSDIL